MTLGPHIFVVDDHRDIRDALARYLEKNFMRATTASNSVVMACPKTRLQRYSNPSFGSKRCAAAIPAVSASALRSRAPRCGRMAAMSPCATAPQADWRRWRACRLIRLRAQSEKCAAVIG